MMMNIKKNTIQLIASNEEALWGQIEQDVRTEAYQTFLQQMRARNMPCPTTDMLYDYVLDILETDETQIVQDHLTYCGKCADDVLRIIRIEEEIESEEQAHDNIPRPFEPLKPASKFHETLLQSVANEYWEPRYAGMEVTAADMRPEPFQFQEGQITIKAFWEGARGDKPAYIWIGWEVRVQPPFHLRLRFIAPETGEILYEANLGQTTKDSESFSADELRFDPTMTRFGIVAFTESPQ